MSSRRAIQLGVAAAMLIAAGALFVRWQSATGRNVDFPEGTLWVCADAACAAEFSKSLKELAAFYDANPDGEMPCPRCGKPGAERALRCPACKRAFARSAVRHGKATCPLCKQPLPPVAPG